MSLAAPPLFPGYCFVWTELQWHAARWAPGVIRLVLVGLQPAPVTEAVIAEARERDGLIDLPKPEPRFAPGVHVRVLEGPLRDHIGVLAALSPHERVMVIVMVLLRMLGGQQRVSWARDAITAIGSGAETRK